MSIESKITPESKVLFTARLGLDLDADEKAIAKQCDLARIVLDGLEITDKATAQKTLTLFADVSTLCGDKPFSDVKAELVELRAFKAGVENRDATADVERALTTHKMPEIARAALLTERLANPAKFAATYPVPSHPSMTQVVTGGGAPILATGGQSNSAINRVQMGAHGALVLGAAQGATQQAASTVDKGAPLGINLALVPGRNTIEKLMNHIKAQPGGDKLTHEQLHEMACEANKQIA